MYRTNYFNSGNFFIMEFGDTEANICEVSAGAYAGNLILGFEGADQHVHKPVVILIWDVDPKQSIDGLHSGAGTEDDRIGNVKFTEEIFPCGK